MHTEGIKEQARRLLDSLPDTATWEDPIYQISLLSGKFG